MTSSDNDAQRQSIERALRLALASGELTWVDESLADESKSDARVRELSELAMSLSALGDSDPVEEGEAAPYLPFEPASSEPRPAQAWGLESPPPIVPDPVPAQKPGFFSSKIQQVALTAICVVLILAAAAFAGAQLIFAAMDANARRRPIGLVIHDRPVELAAGRIVFPN